jgi:eukaryotic-like serine/threonine-protein kinase
MDNPSSINVVASAVQGEVIDLGGQTSPDGAVTLLFSDIEGSTAMIESLGEQRWFELMRDHNAIVRSLCEAHEGTVVKSQGDGFMLAFASAHAALRCAIEIEQAFVHRTPGSPEAFRIRIGAHTGFVIADADDFYGRNVVLAARIADRAGGGEILVSSVAKEYTETDRTFRFEHRGELRLKGLVGEHSVFALLWENEG